MDMQSLMLLVSQKIVPLLCALIGFGLLIGIHEFGHFIFCKLFNIHTPTFSIGFGPELFAKKIGDTNFRLALIPFGGYCEIAGHGEVGQGTQEFAQDQTSRSFSAKPYWQKFLVLCGGILFNLLFAYIVFIGLLWLGSSSKPVVSGIVQNSAAESMNLKAGDQFVSMRLQSATATTTFVYESYEQNLDAYQTMIGMIQKSPGAQVWLEVIRDGALTTLEGIIGTHRQNDQEIGLLGASFAFPLPNLPFAQACTAGITMTHQWLATIAQGFVSLISRRLEGAGGPIMIMSQTFSSAQHSFSAFFFVLAIISLNLAVLNLLPIGILDGGQLLFVTIEAIIRRPLPLALRMGVNIASFGLFVFLALYLTYKDIASLFGSQLKTIYQKLLSLVR